MTDERTDIVILEKPIAPADLVRLAGLSYEGMVKYVVDASRGIIALGGAMHADAEQVLLDHGSRQSDLWGANYYPGRGPDHCIEFVSLINIRPKVGNRSMEIQDDVLRRRVREITHALVGAGEEEGWPSTTAT